ncbi:hypothetical protein D9M71_437440 [compost metagenome]
MAFADDPGIGHGAGVGAGQRAGEGEAGDLVAAGQAWQVMIALFVGAVMQQQFGRAQGVGHHHGRGEVTATGCKLHRHLRVGVGREALAAVFPGNDQGEETVALDVLPGVWRQVQVLADLPVADHGAEFFGGAIDERLFFFREFGLGVAEQGVPVRAAAEQLAVPPHGAGVDGFAFGLRHRRQGALEPAEQRCGKYFAAQVGEQQGGSHCGQQQPENRQQPAWRVAENAHRQQVQGNDAQRRQGGDATVGQVRHADHQDH